MFFPRPPYRLRTVIATLALAAYSYPTHADVRSIVVSPVPGDPAASGSNLIAAMASINSPSATNPYFVKIEPGIYDVGSSRLPLKPWVEVAGSGMGFTTIQGKGDLEPEGPTMSAYQGVVLGASHSTLRDLTIKAIGTKDHSLAIAMSLFGVTDQSLYRVQLEAEGGVAHWGLRAEDSNVHIREVDVHLVGGGAGEVYGIVLRGWAQGRESSLLDSRIEIANSLYGKGIYFAGRSHFSEAKRNTVIIRGTSSSIGIYYSGAYDALFVGEVQYRDFEIVAETPGNNGSSLTGAYGSYGDVDAAHTFIGTTIRTYAENGASVGIRCGAGSLGCPTRIDRSEIVTATPNGRGSAVVGSFDVRIANSLIEGSVAAGTCTGVYDLAYTSYTAPACP
jgi:hypothetical protein